MARRVFVGLTPSFYNQPQPLFNDDDYLSLAGTTSRPWQNRTTNLSVNSGGYPVWGGKYPTVAARHLILNALLGAHLSAFDAGQITQFRNVTWRDRILSSFHVPRAPVAPQPPFPPFWAPVASRPLDSANYPDYALNFDVMWPVNLDIHVMSLWSITDIGPVVMLERPATAIPTMVYTSMQSYVGLSATQLAIQAYTYSGQLPQPADAIQAQVYQWLACILFGSITGRLHRNRTCEGFYFAFPKPANNQDEASLRWNDGARTGAPPNIIVRYVACNSPHWQQSMLHISLSLLAQCTSCPRPIPAPIANARLPAYGQNIPGLSGAGANTRNLDRYNYVDLSVARHAAWFASGLIDAAAQAAYDAANAAQSAMFIRHLTAVELAHPLVAGRIIVKPFAAGSVAAPAETPAVIAAADAMFP
ncbi:VP6 [Green River chinook virus]|uniref:VP6 n=1 Tax=Green River chinook virus TaxID=1382300 RepID=W6EW64_9REOV|nr:VP6 [Green River chinook virus]AHJ14807.1 VP6 [Green River chinook virus]